MHISGICAIDQQTKYAFPILKTVGGVIRTKGAPFWQLPPRPLARHFYNPYEKPC